MEKLQVHFRKSLLRFLFYEGSFSKLNSKLKSNRQQELCLGLRNSLGGQFQTYIGKQSISQFLVPALTSIFLSLAHLAKAYHHSDMYF